MSLFNAGDLLDVARRRAPGYGSADPFPHAIIDGLFDARLLWRAAGSFPQPAQFSWYKYDNPLERKLAMPHVDRLPEQFRVLMEALNSASFVEFLEMLTGISGLRPDPEYVGGGLHQIEVGGKLDIHTDFNYHPTTKLDRRLNVLVFLNERWSEDYGGHLEFWDLGMTRAVQRILPVFNRMVVFNTSDLSNHGHPEPLNCPPGWTRKSLATYYYSDGRPAAERSAPHSTIYKKRPQDSDDQTIEALRVHRARGRLQDLKTADPRDREPGEKGAS